MATKPKKPASKKKPKPKAKASKKAATTRRRTTTARARKYAAARLKGAKPEAAVRAAGYRPKNARNAKSMARRLDQELRDKGELDQAFLESGITQKTIAKVMMDGLEATTVIDDQTVPDTRTRVLTAKTIGHWLGYDDRQEKDEEKGQETAGDFDERQKIRKALVEEIHARRAGGHAGRVGSAG